MNTYTYTQVMDACRNYGMSPDDRLSFEFFLRFPHTPEEVTKHPQWNLKQYMALRRQGFDDEAIVAFWERTAS